MGLAAEQIDFFSIETGYAEQNYFSWFSCGAASAVATKLALDKYGPERVRVVYQQTNSEHPDNARFIADCERWFGVEIEKTQSEKYHDIWEVFAAGYLVGPGGAMCTSELKRRVAENLISWGPTQEIEIFGYTVDEQARVDRFIENNNERRIEPILIDNGITKERCYSILLEAGIQLPMMYRMGYRNNNCIGCVKGGAGYWNKIRVDFPEVFERMAKVERQLGVSIIRKEIKGADGKKTKERVFLDELPPNMGRYKSEPSIQCGMLCGTN